MNYSSKAYLAVVATLFSCVLLTAKMQATAQPCLPTLPKATSFDEFPKEWCALRDLKTKIKKLEADNNKEGELLSNAIRKRTKIDPAIKAKITRDAFKSENRKIASRFNPPFDYNRTGRKLKFYINASDVRTNKQHYILSGLPKTISEAQNYLEAILKQGARVFISLHETGESIDRVHDFWKDSNTQQFKFSDGSKIVYSKTRVLLKGKNGVRNPSQIVETTLSVSNGKTITHLHYDGWFDRTKMPDEDIFQVLLDRVHELSPNKKIPIAINCKGGVGRTGVTALCYLLRRQIDAQLSYGKKLGDIKVNIPEALYALRKQRSGLVQSTEQLIQVYSVIDGYYQRLKSEHSK